MKNKSRFTISTTILALFFVVVGIIATSTLLLQFYFAKELAKDATQHSIELLSKNTLHKIDTINITSLDSISMLELSDKIEEKPEVGVKHPMLKKFITIMQNKEYIYALYTGYVDGTFYEVINLKIDDKLGLKYNVKSNDCWLIVKIFKENGERIEVNEYLDVNLNITHSVRKKTDYNLLLRPWYKEAIASKDMIRTNPYMFVNLEGMGVSYAKKMKNSDTVLSIDISLNSLSKFLKSQDVFNNTELYIFNTNKNKIVASNIDKNNLDVNISKRLSEFILNDKKNMLKNGKNYLISIVEIKSNYFDNEYFIMLFDESALMKPYYEKIYFAIYMNFFLMLITLPIIWYASKIIINPMKLLLKENDKIKERKFEDVSVIDSRIKEINELSYSIVSMSQSIKEYEESEIKFMDSVIEVIAGAIDEKSEYSGGHGQRVPIITMMLAKEASYSNKSIFKNFSIAREEDERELKIAALLHDCGKITTPEYVVDKATKLETIYNRIHEIRTRFEVVHRDLEILYYQKIIAGESKNDLNLWLISEQNKLKENFEFIAKCNIGSEFMSDEDIERIKNIATTSWSRNFDDTLGISKDERDRLSTQDKSNIEYLLDDKFKHIIQRTRSFQEDYDADGFNVTVPLHLYNLGEVYNLTVQKGTLTTEERFKINDHIIMTIKMLEELPFPKHLQRVPEYAGAHHETLIGTGYPKKLTKKDMSIPARIMALADIYEALTAADRPYKEPKKLSESIKILSFMVKDQHIDKDIFELFLTSGVYKEYGVKFLKPEQIDEVDISAYLS